MTKSRHKLKQTAIRISDDLKAQIEAAAKANGETFNKEVSRRLSKSFEPASPVPETQSLGVLTDAVARLIATAMHSAGNETAFLLNNRREHQDRSEHWLDDHLAYQQAKAAVEMLLQGLAPSEKIFPKPDDAWLSDAMDKDLFGKGHALVLMTQICSAAAQAPTSAAASIAPHLGALPQRLAEFVEKRNAALRKDQGK